MKCFFPLHNLIQNYAWGSLDGIASFTGIPNTTQVPQAELWMGAHPAAPSTIEIECNKTITLDKFIAGAPESILGKQTAKTFTNRLPFLFKILSAAKPLSLQVHPSREQAKVGYIRENNAKIPPSSPVRNYKDDNHKPEIIMALDEFTAMCGFRPIENTVRLFNLLNITEFAPVLDRLQIDGNYVEFCRYFLELSGTNKNNVLQAIRSRLNSAKNFPDDNITYIFRLLKDLQQYYPDDTGILAPLYMNVFTLQPGEALYLPAGILHAYIKGTGLELMANSDNVLRAGLTPKHIDVQELLSILKADVFVPTPLRPPITPNSIYHYHTPCAEFELSLISPHNTEIQIPASFPSIILGHTESVILSTESEKHTLGRGESVFIPACRNPIYISGSGIAYMASLPNDTNKDDNLD